MSGRHLKNILVVDDTEIMRDLLAEVLLNDGYHVDKARDGIQAVEMATRQRYDLVITDMHMPRQNGLLTARRIRAIDSQVMIVMTDSYPDKLVEALHREGITAAICKPFDLAELRAMMQKIEELIALRGTSVPKE
jgi:CheY-like chemotaxis protein